MKILKSILYILSMVLITICATISIWLLAFMTKVSTNNVKQIMINTEYYEKIDAKIRGEFNIYINEEKTDEILKEIPVKNSINRILSSIGDNKIETVSGEIRTNVKQVIMDKLTKIGGEQSVTEFASNMSSKYLKLIFPISEVSAICNVINRYNSKVTVALALCVAITILLCFITYFGGKNAKWLVIALYNVIILNILAVCLVSVNNRLALGSITSVVKELVGGVLLVVMIEIGLVFIACMIINYRLYFKKRNVKNKT